LSSIKRLFTKTTVPTYCGKVKGAALPPNDVERFYRIAGNEVQGSGLGLAIVKQIVQRHGASAEVATGADGIGAIFSIKFKSLSPGLVSA